MPFDGAPRDAEWDDDDDRRLWRRLVENLSLRDLVQLYVAIASTSIVGQRPDDPRFGIKPWQRHP
jgi:hypothetical protein